MEQIVFFFFFYDMNDQAQFGLMDIITVLTRILIVCGWYEPLVMKYKIRQSLLHQYITKDIRHCNFMKLSINNVGIINTVPSK